MCGIVGIVNYQENIIDRKLILQKMLDKVKKKDNEQEFYLNINAIFGVSYFKEDKKIMSYKYNDTIYTIVFNGTLYNADELREFLKYKGFEFLDISDTEVILKAFVYYGKDVFKYLNGVYGLGIWNDKERELVLARDRFGIKPLYYTINNGNLIFSSEIKGILEYPDVEAKIDIDGIGEVFGVGPAHTNGKTPFKNIFEIEPAQYLVLNYNEFYRKEYWKLETKYHTDDLEKTCDNIRNLIVDGTEKQLNTKKSLGVLLSGGLDSSIITAIASDYYKRKGEVLDTFSVDYKDNDKNFIKNEFQPNSDNYYIDIMVNEFKTNHRKIILDTPELYDSLKDAMLARDYPGMADVDSSYLLLFKKLKEYKSIALSGECSDEIFGGYPWYFKEEKFNTFPWSTALEERQKILKSEISRKINIKEYVTEKFNNTLKKIEFLEVDSKETKEHRKLIYLTLNWFMTTLLDRTDRMCEYCGFEVGVPFCDYKIIEYAWNIPWEMKAYKGREKGLLRKAMEGYLPDEIIYRKKSPYPKTHNPNYLQKVKEELRKIMENKEAKIHQLLNKEYVEEVLKTEGKNFVKPWFGQLMTGPQFMAYIIQLEHWLEIYNPKIEI